MINVSLRYDLRFPAFAPGTHADRYAACLDQCAWADELGFRSVTLCEHHGVADGFMSAPLTIAAAVAARTRRVGISIVAALLPLHDPIRFAEQCAAIQLISNGRLMLVAGLGYRREEFEMAGVDRTQRGRLLEEHLTVMQKAWSGEPFEWRGRTVQATPRPPTPPVVYVGGSTENAARRAARLGAGFFPAIDDASLADLYRRACAERGLRPGPVVLPRGPGFVHVSEDPDGDWERILPYAMHEATTYASWQPRGQRSTVRVDARTPAELRASGGYLVVTPEQCVEMARRDGGVVLHPLMGGMPAELGWASLRLFAEKVLPQL
jgi:alkanesulfonate monooxygenase SsuD/methylene tetrahydromethanopterin reductase-like flavin-dependent oxidoreductase (luciferase family)